MQPTHSDRPSITTETGLYILAAAVALLLRLMNLGHAPLTEAEAREALAVWRFVQAAPGVAPLQVVSPLWFALTSFAFAMFGSSEFMVRLWPALAGSALVLMPLTFRRELGRGAALAASGLLAVSPVLLAASRTADGATLAALSLWLMVAGWRRFVDRDDGRGLALTGAALGMGLADGPRFFSVVAAGLFALVVVVLARPETVRDVRDALRRLRPHAGRVLLVAVTVFVAASSAALVNRPGLAAAGQAAPVWLSGWAPSAAARPVSLVPMIFGVYEPLALVFGLVGLYVAYLAGMLRAVVARFQTALELPGAPRRDVPPERLAAARGRSVEKALGAAALGALVFALAYPARQAGDALWVALPLTLLAAMMLVEAMGGEGNEEWPTVGAQAAVLLVMLVFAYFNVAAFARGYQPNTSPYATTLLLAGGVLLLGVVVTILFSAGWSRQAAVRGATVSVGAAMLVGTLAAGLGLTQWRAADPRELWSPDLTTDPIRLLMQTVRDVSNREAGNDSDLEIVVLNDPARDDRHGLLGWELRGYPNAVFVDALSPTIGAPLVIADAGVVDPTLGSAYVGQKFGVFGHWAQAPQTLAGWIDWWLFRAVSVDYARKVVWVRQDVQLLQSK